MADGAPSRDAPVVMLTNVILVSAVKKRAASIRIERTGITFVIGGIEHAEMRPPAEVLPAVVRRLAIMANLPVYPRGSAAEGLIHLVIGSDREAYFATRIMGHGDDLRATLVQIRPDELARRERL